MTDNDIIAELSKENMKLKNQNKNYQEALKDIKSKLISIGAPLNDNILKYNKKQLKIFFTIKSIIDYVYKKRERNE